MEAQHIDRFIKERCDILADAKIDNPTLFRAFAAWANEKNIYPFPARDFFRLLDETGKVQRGDRCFLRIRLRERYANPPPVARYS